MSNTSIRRRACSVAADAVLAVVALFSLPSASMAQADPSHRLYRCVVLGETRACPPSPVVPGDRVEVQRLAGPYARYLMHIGMDPTRAMEAARTSGEKPVGRTVRITTRELTGLETYELYQGRLSTSRTRQEILAEVPVEGPAVQACATVCGNEAR